MRGIFPTAVALASVGAFAQDVVKLAPEQVKVVFENDRVRVRHSTSRDTASFPCTLIQPT